jgi:predicted AAA+ superfamily ATPase
MLLESSSPDLGHQLENIVYLELLRRGHRVSIGKLAEKEIDFVVTDSNATESVALAYYQVAASVLDPATLVRELEGLKKIKDNYPKYLLTLDDIPSSANHDGIIQINLIDWLLKRKLI